MQIPIFYDWNTLTPKKAIALQRELAKQVIRADCLGQVQTVAGVDMAINERNSMARAAVVLVSFPDMQIIEQQIYEEHLLMPYIPGLLSFRELPSIIGALRKLVKTPDLIMVDGMGIAHPRRFGIASHLGVLLDMPTIGCGKSLLIGNYVRELLASHAGSWVALTDKGETVGAAVRTRTGVNPVFISLGHKISLETSIGYILSSSKGYRLPEPIRLADKLSKTID